MKFPEHIQTWKHNAATNEDTLRQLLEVQPKTITDVGAGDGFYGKLVRHALPDVTSLVGVEKTAEYIADFGLDSIYDKVINADICEVVQGISADLMIFGDVLEHLEHDSAHAVLDQALQRCRWVLVNAPLGWQPQEHENPNEIHRCGLNKEDFSEFDLLEWNHRGRMFNALLKGDA
jgi:trans-aconitate methyltransferase